MGCEEFLLAYPVSLEGVEGADTDVEATEYSFEIIRHESRRAGGGGFRELIGAQCTEDASSERSPAPKPNNSDYISKSGKLRPLTTTNHYRGPTCTHGSPLMTPNHGNPAAFPTKEEILVQRQPASTDSLCAPV